jgi:hypothetical protein
MAKMAEVVEQAARTAYRNSAAYVVSTNYNGGRTVEFDALPPESQTFWRERVKLTVLRTTLKFAEV